MIPEQYSESADCEIVRPTPKRRRPSAGLTACRSAAALFSGRLQRLVGPLLVERYSNGCSRTQDSFAENSSCAILSDRNDFGTRPNCLVKPIEKVSEMG